MLTPTSKKRTHQRAIEWLAKEAHLPFDAVARLYDEEWARLEAGARITGFLPVIALRNLRERLLREMTPSA